MLKKERN